MPPSQPRDAVRCYKVWTPLGKISAEAKGGRNSGGKNKAVRYVRSLKALPAEELVKLLQKGATNVELVKEDGNAKKCAEVGSLVMVLPPNELAGMEGEVLSIADNTAVIRIHESYNLGCYRLKHMFLDWLYVIDSYTNTK